MREYWQRANYLPVRPLGEGGRLATGSPEHLALAQKIAEEGIVLAKNNGVLPLARGTKIAVFGKAQKDYVKGGGGSGDVSTPYIRSLQDGFAEKQAEGKLEVFEPLTKFYADYVTARYAAQDKPGRVVEAALPQELVDSARAWTDTAMVVISRFSGEGYDRTGDANDGDFYLSLAEEAMVEQVETNPNHSFYTLQVGMLMMMR